MDELTDESPMPFGKYGPDGEARRMKDVPAAYLVWLLEHGLKHTPRVRRPATDEEVASNRLFQEKRVSVRGYIERDEQAIRREADGK